MILLVITQIRCACVNKCKFKKYIWLLIKKKKNFDIMYIYVRVFKIPVSNDVTHLLWLPAELALSTPRILQSFTKSLRISWNQTPGYFKVPNLTIFNQYNTFQSTYLVNLSQFRYISQLVLVATQYKLTPLRSKWQKDCLNLSGRVHNDHVTQYPSTYTIQARIQL